MKVRELIELLQKQDLEMDVMLQGPPHEGWDDPAGVTINSWFGEKIVLIESKDRDLPK